MRVNTRLDAQFTHFGLHTFDLEGMAQFYMRWFGLLVTDKGIDSRGNQLVFLSRSAQEHHQLVLANNRTSVESPVNQISFRLPSLENLRSFYAQIVEGKVKIQ